MVMKQPTIAAFLTIIVLFILEGCAANEPAQPDYYELLSLRSLPKGNELKDECTCLNEDIISLGEFAEKMNNSKYAVHYQAMSQQKISAIRGRADVIGCKYPIAQ
jgi:hypothetical protein